MISVHHFKLTSSLELLLLLNDVTSMPFFSLLLNSVSSTVFTVLVELPSTRPNVDRPWVVNLANRNGIRDVDADLGLGVDCKKERRERELGNGISRLQNIRQLNWIILFY